MPFVDRPTTRICYQDVGSGPCVVLTHSFLCDGEMWRAQVPVLAESYRVLNIDLRGHGSSGPASGPATLYDLVDDVLAVMDSVGVERAVWARRFRNRVLGLGVRWMGIDPFVAPITRLMFGKTTRRERPDLVNAWTAGARELHIPSVLEILNTLNKRDSVLGRLSGVSVPALVLVGEEDVSLPPSCSEQLTADLGDAKWSA